MTIEQPVMLELSAGRPKDTTAQWHGRYLCSHCGEVLIPSLAQIEIAENAPAANPALKCSHCHKHAVYWVKAVATKAKKPFKPVSAAVGQILFAEIYRMLAEI